MTTIAPGRLRNRRLPTALVCCAVAVAGLAATPGEGRALPGRWSTAGLAGGYVESIAVHPTVPGTVLAGTRQGAFLTRDGGTTWAPASAGLTQLMLRDVTFDRDRPDVAYAAATGGLFKSVTGGTAWALLPVGFGDMLEIEVLYRDTPRLLVNTTWSLKASDDGGLTWRKVYDERRQLFDMAVSPEHPNLVYLLVHDLDADVTILERSNDAGETWTEVSRGTDLWSLDVDPRSPGTLNAVAAGTLLRSTDGGATWESGTLPATAAGNPEMLTRSPSHPETLYASGYYQAGPGKFILRSDDGGATWSHAGDVAEHAYPAPLAVDPRDREVVYAGTFGNGMLVSRDGGRTFDYENTGLAALPARDIAVDPVNPARSFAAAWTRTLFRSEDAGATWADVEPDFGDPAHPLAPVVIGAVGVDAASEVYAGRYLDEGPARAAVFRSGDGGRTWDEAGSFPDSRVPRSLVAHRSEAGWLLAGTLGGVYRTKDRAATWEAVGPFDGPVEDIAVAPAGDAVYVATGDDVQGNAAASRLYVSHDFGGTWERLTYPPMRHAISLGVRSVPSVLYAGSGSSSDIAFSLDGGGTWVERDVDPTNFASSVAAIAPDPLDPTQVLAGTESGGLWLSRDAGVTWIPTTPGIYGQAVYDIAFAPAPTVPALVGVTLPRRAGVSKVVLAPHAFRRPHLDNPPAPGRTVECIRGRWSRARGYAYAWTRDGVTIEGADDASYRVRPADAGTEIACRVAARGPGGRGRAVSRPLAVD